MNSIAFNVGVGRELEKQGFLPLVAPYLIGKRLAGGAAEYGKGLLNKGLQNVDLKQTAGWLEQAAPEGMAHIKSQVGDIAAEAVTNKMKDFGSKALPWIVGGAGLLGVGALMNRRKKQPQQPTIINNYAGPAQPKSMAFDKPGLTA